MKSLIEALGVFELTLLIILSMKWKLKQSAFGFWNTIFLHFSLYIL